jgi:hypothetical protein
MLWAKEQREIFAKKYPNMDFSSLSKKLSDLWATVPPNQKKMWKNKAAKIMKKNANVMDNMKRSGPLPTPKGKKPRGRPRIHPIVDERNGAGGDLISAPGKSPTSGAKKTGLSHKDVAKTSQNSSSTQSSWKKPNFKPVSAVKPLHSSAGFGSSKVGSKNRNVQSVSSRYPSKASNKSSSKYSLPPSSIKQ